VKARQREGGRGGKTEIKERGGKLAEKKECQGLGREKKNREKKFREQKKRKSITGKKTVGPRRKTMGRKKKTSLLREGGKLREEGKNSGKLKTKSCQEKVGHRKTRVPHLTSGRTPTP